MMRFQMLAALLALTPPAEAQDAMTAETFLQTFTDGCATIAAKVAISIVTDDDDSSGFVTTDGTVLQMNTQMDMQNAMFANLFYSRLVMPADRIEICALNVNFTDIVTPVAVPDLVALIDQKVAGLLGAPATRRGSDIFADGQIAQSYIWSTGDSVTDDSISIMQSGYFAQVTLNRRIAAN